MVNGRPTVGSIEMFFLWSVASDLSWLCLLFYLQRQKDMIDSRRISIYLPCRMKRQNNCSLFAEIKEAGIKHGPDHIISSFFELLQFRFCCKQWGFIDITSYYRWREYQFYSLPAPSHLFLAYFALAILSTTLLIVFNEFSRQIIMEKP